MTGSRDTDNIAVTGNACTVSVNLSAASNTLALTSTAAILEMANSVTIGGVAEGGDGVVGFDDLLQLAQHYSQNGLDDPKFEADWTLVRSLVPEPSSLCVVAGALCFQRRRPV